MTSWAEIEVRGKKVIAKLGGYTGKSEHASPIGDIMSANRAWIDKTTARRLKLRIGQRVKVKVGRRVVFGKVYKWSRGSRQIIFDEPLNLSRREAERVRVRW